MKKHQKGLGNSRCLFNLSGNVIKYKRDAFSKVKRRSFVGYDK